MEQYTASNGIRISINETLSGTYLSGVRDRQVPTESPYVDTHATGSAEGIDALREFFRAEEDERFGRWRSTVDPDWTAVVDPGPGIISFRHDDGLRAFDVDTDGAGLHRWDHTLQAVAREFLDAHPEPKPWCDAVEGDVWVITYNGSQFPAIFQAGRFRDHAGSWDASSITEARKIWPEDAS